MESKTKKTVSYNISKKLLDQLELLSRKDLRNKSALVENLLAEWLKKYQNEKNKSIQL